MAEPYRFREAMEAICKLPPFERGWKTYAMIDRYRDGMFRTGDRKYPYICTPQLIAWIDALIEGGTDEQTSQA